MFPLNARSSCRRTGWFAAAGLSRSACNAQPGIEIKPHRIGSNLQLRISRDDLGDLVPAAPTSAQADAVSVS